jgi:hypothetical protein
VRPGFELGYEEGGKYYIYNHLRFNVLVHPTHGEYMRARQGMDSAVLGNIDARKLLGARGGGGAAAGAAAGGAARKLQGAEPPGGFCGGERGGSGWGPGSPSGGWAGGAPRVDGPTVRWALTWIPCCVHPTHCALALRAPPPAARAPARPSSRHACARPPAPPRSQAPAARP